MPTIKPSCVREIKARANIVDVVGRVASLKKAGSRFKALCPFHQEKSPSFHVNPDSGLYKCFGCGKAGDAIEFVRETEQLTFTEAVEALAKRFGATLEYEEGSGPTREERSLRQELFDLHELAAEHFHQTYRSSTPAGNAMRELWEKQRRFSPELAEEFKIGAAPAEDNGLAALLMKRKFSEDALRQSGMFFIREGAVLTLSALRPRFRGRLMIPIRDHQSRVVAFTARQTSLTPADDPAREAKYVNSPETPIFTKGHLLFNLDRARTHAKEGAPFVMVEGQLDALRSWSVGVKTTVATQGTALTETQLNLLRRYHNEIECLFDSDSAGQKAALRLLPLALKAGIEVRFLSLAGAEKLDPDLLFLERGYAAYEQLKANKMSAMAFACRSVLPEPDKVSTEARTRACQTLFDIIRHAESEVARLSFVEQIAAHLRLPLSALRKDFEAFQGKNQRYAPKGPTQGYSPEENAAPQIVSEPGSATSGGVEVKDSPERHLLLLCLHFESIGKPLSLNLPHDWINSSDLSGRLLNRFLSEFEQDAWPGRDHLEGLLETPEEKALVASLLFEAPDTDEPVKLANQALLFIRDRYLKPKLRQIELALANVREDSNVDAISLIRQRTELQRQLRTTFGLPDAV